MGGDYKNKRIVVVGGGLSGLALARFFASRGAQVTVSDSRPAERLDLLSQLEESGAALDLGGHTAEIFRAADLVAISPGVPLDIPVLIEAASLGIPILGEVEIAFRHLEAPMMAITGTNGKSTTTAVAGEVFEAWGKRTFVGGNIGTPLVSAVDGAPWDWIVAEISSFQLEAIEAFRPRYALLLNITEDHLDRYPDMAAYMAAKGRIFENLGPQDVAVLNGSDSRVLELAAGCPARKVLFTTSGVPSEGMGLDGSEIVWNWKGEQVRFAVEELQLRGEHNVENVMAAMIPALMEGCPPQLAWKAACGFSGLPHRMTLVRRLAGVTWYNDSKGTNVGSVVKSLSGLRSPVTLIAGGKDKGGDYAPLREEISSKVAHLVLIGQAAPRMAEAFAGLTDIVRAGTMEDAVEKAAALTPPGGTVLLSPGCSSFDMFKGYDERGDVFCRAVLALPEKGER